jgi:hypothetical protein
LFKCVFVEDESSSESEEGSVNSYFKVGPDALLKQQNDILQRYAEITDYLNTTALTYVYRPKNGGVELYYKILPDDSDDKKMGNAFNKRYGSIGVRAACWDEKTLELVAVWGPLECDECCSQINVKEYSKTCFDDFEYDALIPAEEGPAPPPGYDVDYFLGGDSEHEVVSSSDFNTAVLENYLKNQRSQFPVLK